MPCLCVPFFRCFFPCFFWAVSKDVQEKTGMHPSYLEIADLARNMDRNRKILLMAARGDAMISYHHAIRLHEVLPGETKLLLFEGTHNSERAPKILVQVFEFIERHLFPTT